MPSEAPRSRPDGPPNEVPLRRYIAANNGIFAQHAFRDSRRAAKKPATARVNMNDIDMPTDRPRILSRTVRTRIRPSPEYISAYSCSPPPRRPGTSYMSPNVP